MTPTKEQYEKATRLLRIASGGMLEPQDLEWQNARAKADKEFAELIAQFAADEAEAAREAAAQLAETWGNAPPNPNERRAALAKAIRAFKEHK